MAIIGGLGEVAATKTAGRPGQSVLVGTVSLTGTNPTTVATPFRSITGAALTLNTSTAPGTGTSDLTWTASANVLQIYGWMPSAAGTTTLVASTGTEKVGYAVIGKL